VNDYDVPILNLNDMSELAIMDDNIDLMSDLSTIKNLRDELHLKYNLDEFVNNDNGNDESNVKLVNKESQEEYDTENGESMGRGLYK